MYKKNEKIYNLKVTVKKEKNKIKASYFIDNFEYGYDNYLDELRNISFPQLKENKLPSFRQILTRHNRYKPENIEEPLKTLRFGKGDDYEAMNLLMLGIVPLDVSVLSSLKTELKFYKKMSKNILGTKSIAFLKESLRQTEEWINLHNDWENLLDENSEIKKDIEILDQIRAQIASFSNNLSSEKFSKTSAERSIEKLISKKSDINFKELELIYKNAGIYNNNLHLDFEEFVNIHNELISDKVQFLEKNLTKTLKTILNLEKELETLTEEESKLVRKIEKLDTLKNIKEELKIWTKVNYEKAELSEQLKNVEENNTKLTDLNRKIENMENQLKNLRDYEIISARVNQINNYFQDISKSVMKNLVVTSFILDNDDHKVGKDGRKLIQGNLKFEFVDQSNSSGFKQNTILFFDVARILFAQENNFDFLGFVLDDKKEIVFSVQIEQAVNYLRDKNVQVIISILRENIQNIGADDCIILSLSTKNKFLNIESLSSD